ncbi:MAG: DJ-1/PfpI family protein [Culturomica sp.]|jgi:4-methyl-5(b-hydroxyethyl)-thiazole monophosphate biosynthesis|nr:DJ-1/PfpI family protein [Culturomica sp.]
MENTILLFNAYLFLADGFEEMEALNTVDVLRRAGVQVTTVSIKDAKEVTGAHQIMVIADKMLTEVLNEKAEILIFPGGMPGAKNLGECDPLIEMLKKHFAKGGKIAAICAAPAMVFGKLILKEGTRLTCYPGFESYLSKYDVTDEGVVVDGNVITAKGPAYAVDFGLTIVEQIIGKEKAQEVASGLLYVW